MPCQKRGPRVLELGSIIRAGTHGCALIKAKYRTNHAVRPLSPSTVDVSFLPQGLVRWLWILDPKPAHAMRRLDGGEEGKR